jgi:hypothetical protein
MKTYGEVKACVQAEVSGHSPATLLREGKRPRYQLNMLDGPANLYGRFEEERKKNSSLCQESKFDASRARPVPYLPIELSMLSS